MTKKWKNFQKKKFFRKKFFEKISRLVYKTPGRWSQIEKKKMEFFFWKILKKRQNIWKKVVNFIFLEIVPRFWFSNREKWVLWGLRNTNLPSGRSGQARNSTFPFYHTWVPMKPKKSEIFFEISFFALKPFTMVWVNVPHRGEGGCVEGATFETDNKFSKDF